MTRAHPFRFAGVAALVALVLHPMFVVAQGRPDSTTSVTTEGPTITLTPRQPGIGSLVRLTIRRANRPSDSLAAVTGSMAGEPLHFHADDTGDLRAFGPIPIEVSDSVVARVVLSYASGDVDSLRLAIPYPHRPVASNGRPPRARRLRVSGVYTARPDSLTEKRIEREAQQARAVGRRAHDTPQLWSLPFLRPRTSRITSAFGSGRVFNGRLSSSHGGVDFAGQPGDAVRAANRGVVALVASFFLAGNVVYVDHGAGVVTGYFHLTEATVAEGDTVERGQQIGLVGATGRVTGPHLHWSARYGQYTVDPMGLIELTAELRTKASSRGSK